MGAGTTSFHFKRLYRPRSRRGRSRQELKENKSRGGLAALVRETLGEDPFSGTIYVFHSKRADRVKMVAWDRER
jgi:transposase